jgi:hypothetical protein
MKDLLLKQDLIFLTLCCLAWLRSRCLLELIVFEEP